MVRTCDRVRTCVVHSTVVGAVVISMTALFDPASVAHASTLFFPREIAEETNAAYNHNCFWGGPRGMDYAALPNPQPIQVPNLYPDKGSTYFVSQFTLPPGASLTIHGVYPRERYFSFTAANELGNGVVGNGDFLRDEQIQPDPGSVNPYDQANNDRTPTGQTYTLTVVQGLVPSNPANHPANTLFTGRTDGTGRVAMRNYVPDQDLLGTGGVDLPQVTVNLADGSQLTGDAMCAAVNAVKTATPTGFPQAAYYKQVNLAADPTNAPAKPISVFERFWNNNYSLLGLFTDDPLARVLKYPATDDGGYATNPDTRYVFTALSLNFGRVIVVRGKMPTYAQTRPNAETWTQGRTQVRYWSACTAQGPVSGKGSDCAYDQQVPLDEDGDYTLVISKPEDRPANANTVCGVKWLDFGIGEGAYSALSTVPNSGPRDWVAALYLRYMDSDPNWAQSPIHIPQPTTTDPYNHIADVMGEYTPVVNYETKADYEGMGCASGAPRLDAGSSTPNPGAFQLDWNAVMNTLPQQYTLQHRNAASDWSTVGGSPVTDTRLTFDSGAPEAEGTWTYRVGAIDVSASETAPAVGDFGPASDPVKVDRTPPNAPTVSADRGPDYAGGGGWYRDIVTVSFTDNGDPALPDGSSGAGVNPASVPAPRIVTANGAVTVAGAVNDNAGNTSAVGSLTVQVDAAAPHLSVACPAVLLLHATGSATTTASDGESGLAVDPSGSTSIDTSTVGPKTVTQTATDNVGHSTTMTCTTQVQYRYSGLLQPVNSDGSSSFKLGATVPFKFQLTDVNGAPVSGAIAHLLVAMTTNNGEGTFQGAVSTSQADSNNAFRETAPGNYLFNLATKGLMAGTWIVEVMLDDGTNHTTHISLK